MAERKPAKSDPVALCRAALLGEPVRMSVAEFEGVRAGDAFTPDEVMELRHLVRQNRITLHDR